MTCKHGLQEDECAYCTGFLTQPTGDKTGKRLPAPIRDFLEAYSDSFYTNDEWGIKRAVKRGVFKPLHC